MRPLVIAPADVHPHRLRRDVARGMVERRDVALGDAQELGVGQVLVLVVAAEPRSGASICRMKPALWIASYSCASASDSAST